MISVCLLDKSIGNSFDLHIFVWSGISANRYYWTTLVVVPDVAGADDLGLSWRLPSPAGSGDHPTNEAEQIVDNSVVHRSVIVLKSGMPFRTGKQVSKT